MASSISEYINPDGNIPTIKFYAQLCEYMKTKDPAYTEYVRFINNLEEHFNRFATREIIIGNHVMKLRFEKVNILGMYGTSKHTDEKLLFQTQAPSKAFGYKVTCEIVLKLYTKISPTYVKDIPEDTQTLATVTFTIPKMFNCNEEDGLDPYVRSLLKDNDLTENRFQVYSNSYAINYKEGSMVNNFLYTSKQNNEITADIISVKKEHSNLSVYLKINHNTVTRQTEVETNVSALKRSITFSFSSLFMLAGFFNPKSVTKLLVSVNDPHFHAIIDTFNSMWTTPHKKQDVETTRKAKTLTDFYAAIKMQIQKDKNDVFSNIDTTKLSEILLKDFLPHLDGVYDNGTNVKGLMLCRYVYDYICVILNITPSSDRYTYTNKVITSPTAQLEKLVSTSVLKETKELISACYRNAEKLIMPTIGKFNMLELDAFKKSSLASKVRTSEYPIDIAISTGIVTGSSEDAKDKKTAKANSRMLPKRSPYQQLQSNSMTYITGSTVKTATSKHDTDRRKHHQTGIMLDNTFTPDASKIGLNRELCYCAVITPRLYKDEILDIYENTQKILSQLDYVHKLTYFEDYIDRANYLVLFNGSPIKYTVDGPELYNVLHQMRIDRKINHYLSIVIDVYKSTINLYTIPNRPGVVVIVGDPETNSTKLTKEEAQGDIKINFDELFNRGALTTIYALETDNLVVSTDPKHIRSKYFLPPIMNMSFASLGYVAGVFQSDSSRIAMTQFQMLKFGSAYPSHVSTNIEKSQYMAITSCEPNYTATLEPTYKIGAMNVTIALSMGPTGDMNNDATTLGSHIANTECIFINITKKPFKANDGEMFLNPNTTGNTIYNERFAKLNPEGHLTIGTILENGDVMAVIGKRDTTNFDEFTWDENEIARVTNVSYEYVKKDAYIVTYTLEHVLKFKDADKLYIINACKSVATICPEKFMPITTKTNKIIGLHYSSDSMRKRQNIIGDKTSIMQSLLSQDPEADPFAKIYMGAIVKQDLMEVANLLVDNLDFIGVEHLIDPLTGIISKEPVVVYRASCYRTILLSSHYVGMDDGTVKISEQDQQPLAGRKNKGGLKAGGAFRNSLAEHGSASAIRSHYIKNSDGKEFPICTTCGLYYALKYNEYNPKRSHCSCGQLADIKIVPNSFAFVILANLLLSRGIVVKQIFDNGEVGTNKPTKLM